MAITYFQHRSNPYEIWTEDDICALDKDTIESVAKGIFDLENEVWGHLGITSTMDLDRLLHSMLHKRSVICGVAYEKPEDIYGPYLAYVMGYNLDESDPAVRMRIAGYEDLTGQSYEQLLEEIPSHKLYIMLSWTRGLDKKAIAENNRLSLGLLKYFKKKKIGLCGEFREASSYPIIKRLETRGDFVMKMEHPIPNYLGDGETYYIIVGYFK